ncbi:MAG: AAA family ATPase [Lachnospiraceae bacterium]|nr:AAA family ATPase [Lachnospiraceae bacterium]
MILEIERLRSRRDNRQGISWFMLERAIAKKAWVERTGMERAVWPYEDALAKRNPKVVTFYSFKGGMGRTTALAAAALSLAKEGKNILAIDTDIEAPGLASLFFDETSMSWGTVDYLLEASVCLEGETVDMSRMILQVTDPVVTEDLTGNIFVIPAGTVDGSYLQKLARIDYQDAIPHNMKRQLARLITDAVEAIAPVCKVDYILLDSRAGFHDMGGVITAQIPHGVVLFGKDSRQSWYGMEQVIQAISTSQEERPFVLLVDSACGRDGLVGDEEKRSFKNQAYMVCCDAYYWEDEQQPGPEAVDEAHSPVFVPYQPLLAGNIQLFSDGTQVQNEMVRQMKQMLMGESYQQIKTRIRQWFAAGEEEQDGQAGDS